MVFPIPAFEIHSDQTIPDSKTELMNMLNKKKAIVFHAFVCQNCHLVPNFDEWKDLPDSSQMSVAGVGKRVDKFAYWEPFYISDNTEPLFDERVTWEGQSNKRIQAAAMCLMDYEFHILHPAYLVHHPGIKVYNKKKNTARLAYVNETNRLIFKVIIPEYRLMYGYDKKCRV